MKYTVETHGVGYTETLEFKGKTYKKEYKGDFSGTSTQDKDFWEQIEASGIDYYEILDAVQGNIDGSSIGFDISEIANEWE